MSHSTHRHLIVFLEMGNFCHSMKKPLHVDDIKIFMKRMNDTLWTIGNSKCDVSESVLENEMPLCVLL